MSVRISIGQALLAGICASPFMAVIFLVLRSNWANQAGLWKSFFGPFIGYALLLWLPVSVANLAALMLLRWLGSGLNDTRFHLMVGLVAGVLLVLIVDRVSRGMAQMGGGPLQAQTVLALVGAGMMNAGWIWIVWRFGLKSNAD